MGKNQIPKEKAGNPKPKAAPTPPPLQPPYLTVDPGEALVYIPLLDKFIPFNEARELMRGVKFPPVIHRSGMPIDISRLNIFNDDAATEEAAGAGASGPKTSGTPGARTSGTAGAKTGGVGTGARTAGTTTSSNFSGGQTGSVPTVKSKSTHADTKSTNSVSKSAPVVTTSASNSKPTAGNRGEHADDDKDDKDDKGDKVKDTNCSPSK